MRKSLILAVLFLNPFIHSNAQNTGDLNDRLALKNIVDTFSVLADTKEVDKQVLLFTEDAHVESVVGGRSMGEMIGRKAIGDAFSGFLARFKVVYHLNGQQTLAIDGNKATGISYCQVTLIGEENGKDIKTTMGVYYNDEYVKKNGRWFISKRRSNFAWQDRSELGK